MSAEVMKYHLEKHLRAMFLEKLQKKFGTKKASKILETMLDEMENRPNELFHFAANEKKLEKLLEETIAKIEKEEK